MSIGSTFNSKVMAQASPASPAPKRAKIPSTIRNVTSIEPRPYKYTYRKCQIMTNGYFDAFGAIFRFSLSKCPSVSGVTLRCKNYYVSLKKIEFSTRSLNGITTIS